MKFKYGDYVQVTEGFFKDVRGRVTDRSGPVEIESDGLVSYEVNFSADGVKKWLSPAILEYVDHRHGQQPNYTLQPFIGGSVIFSPSPPNSGTITITNADGQPLDISTTGTLPVMPSVQRINL